MMCPHCGSSFTGYDGSDVSCVCRNCGAVLEEGALQNESIFMEGSQNVSVNVNFVQSGTEATSLPDEFMKCVRSVSQRTRVSKGKEKGLTTIREIFRHLSVGEKHLFQEATDMYMTASVLPHYKFQSLQKKEVLAGVCAAVVCRNHNIPVTLKFISKLLGVAEPTVASAFFKFRKKSNKPVKLLNILGHVSIICGGQSEECLKFTKDVVSVAKKTWVVEGRFQNVIIMAANYLAWQALDFINRRNVTLKDYTQQQGWKFHRCLFLRYKELGNMFCSLASKLPWLSGKPVELKLVAYYLKDVVSYHMSLIKDVNSDFERKFSDLDCDVTSDKDVFKSVKKNMESAQSSTSQYEQIVLPVSFMKQSSTPEIVMKNEDNLIAIHPNMDSEILSEADIKEEDLSQYIRQPEEVARFLSVDAHCHK